MSVNDNTTILLCKNVSKIMSNGVVFVLLPYKIEIFLLVALSALLGVQLLLRTAAIHFEFYQEFQFFMAKLAMWMPSSKKVKTKIEGNF